ncbi:adenine nucleotide alpha hydrolase family protein [Desulfocurvus sp. DL9XJH121]
MPLPMSHSKTYDALALFSAGLDSILAARTIQDLGLAVKCLHFTSPFFGDADKVAHWSRTYGLDVEAVDVGRDFVRMMRGGPKFGFGKYFNPCVDCKILLLTRARELMPRYGATFIVTGEVVGQRPMSQRPDAMNSVRNESGTKGILLRPLCAKRMEPTPMEESGRVDRERLHDFWGRGRTAQLELARTLGISEIPTPAGGCLLAEPASARRYAPVLERMPEPGPEDFHLANLGRQYWAGTHWLAIGRDQGSNQRLAERVAPGDLVFDVKDFPGPLALGRQFAGPWSAEAVADAAAFTASFCPRARRAGGEVDVVVRSGDESRVVNVLPTKDTVLPWTETAWEDAAPVRDALDGRRG